MRITDPLLVDTAYAKGKAPTINLKHGGQFGPMIDEASFFLGNPVPNEHAICRVVDYPKGFNLLGEEGKRYKEALKSLVELHAESWEGIPYKKNVETEEVPYGNDGQSIKIATNVTREPVNVTFNFGREVAGNAKHNFFDSWIDLLIGDTQSKVPLVTEIDGVEGYQKTLEFYGFTAVFFTPDPWHRTVLKAALIRGLFPVTNGDEDIKRAPQSAKEIKTVEIEFGGFAIFDKSARDIAQQELNAMNKAGFNPNNRAPVIKGVEASLAALDNGYSEMVNRVAGSVE